MEAAYLGIFARGSWDTPSPTVEVDRSNPMIEGLRYFDTDLNNPSYVKPSAERMTNLVSIPASEAADICIVSSCPARGS